MMDTSIRRRAAAAMIAVLFLASTALGSPRVAEAGSTSLGAGACVGLGTSRVSPSPALGATIHSSGYEDDCFDYFLDCTYVYGGFFFLCPLGPNLGWYDQNQIITFPSGTTFVASQHNICDVWSSCNGQVGTSS